MVEMIRFKTASSRTRTSIGILIGMLFTDNDDRFQCRIYLNALMTPRRTDIQ